MPQPVNIPANLQFTTASLNQSSRQVQQALGRITGQASEFQKSLDASTARVFAFGATTTVLQAVNQSFKKLIGTTIEVEKRLIEINSIFQATASDFNKFRNSIFQVAKDTGQAFNTVAEGAAELARQGLSAEETAKRLEAALILTRISGLDAEKSVKSLTAAINGFASAGLTAEQIVNKMVAVDTAFAVSAQDLADGFARAGSTAEDAGVSFDELLGLITAVEQRTARGGAVIGNAFKSIFTRLSRGKTIDELKELGVQIDANQTGIQKLQALSAALEEISDPTVASKIKELAGGVFQINVVSSTLKDLSSETSIFAGAAATAANASNEAFQKNELLNKSLAAQINSLVVSLTSFGKRLVN
jgi:TP901 family phage tail tape measure protein